MDGWIEYKPVCSLTPSILKIHLIIFKSLPNVEFHRLGFIWCFLTLCFIVFYACLWYFSCLVYYVCFLFILSLDFVNYCHFCSASIIILWSCFKCNFFNVFSINVSDFYAHNVKLSVWIYLFSNLLFLFCQCFSETVIWNFIEQGGCELIEKVVSRMED